MSLYELEQKEAIRTVIDSFANLEIDVEKQAQYFTTDAHIMVHMNGELAMDIHGPDEMKKQFGAFTSNVKASQHLNGQQVITLDSETTATNVHYCRATLLTTDEDGNNQITDNYIRYVDTLVKENDEWKISVRDQCFLMMSETRSA